MKKAAKNLTFFTKKKLKPETTKSQYLKQLRVRSTRQKLTVTDRPGEAVPITKVDKKVAIQYLEKDIKVLI